MIREAKAIPRSSTSSRSGTRATSTCPWSWKWSCSTICSPISVKREGAMKLTVISGRGGKIVGTAHAGGKGNPAAGSGGPIAGRGQKLQVIDLPKDLERITDAKELHRRLKAHLKSLK